MASFDPAIFGSGSAARIMLTRSDLRPLDAFDIPCAAEPGVIIPPWPSAYEPVISLAVFRQDQQNGEEILVGVRDPRTNRYHPDVVSVPTRRIKSLGYQMFSEALVGDIDTWLMRFAVRELLATKVGVGDWLEVHDWKCVLRRFDFGQSVIGDNKVERLGMIGIEVNVGHDCELPTRTASYSHLDWLSLSDFMRLAVHREAWLMPIGLKAADVCVYGLCMHSAAEIVAETRPAALSALDSSRLEAER